MGREYELKFKASPQVLSAIREKFGGFSPIAMETAYYDTEDLSLSKRKWMLRRRMENGKAICTLKTPLPDGSRGEWETESEDIRGAVLELCKFGAPADLELLAKAGLKEVCAARLTRLAAVVALPQCTVEIALDEGFFLGGGKEIPFSELEVELKEGSEEAAAAFAQALAEEFSLEPEPKSKVQRAMELI